jgi:hypothetical protein
MQKVEEVVVMISVRESKYVYIHLINPCFSDKGERKRGG